MNTGPQAPAGPATPKPSYKGWAGIRRAFGTPSALTLAVLGFGSGLPFLAIASLTLSTRLRDSGLDLHSIGLISLASVFYLFKFLWAPLLDRYVFAPLGFLGRRRSWLLAAQAGVSYRLNDQWTLNAAVATARVKTHLTATVAGQARKIDIRFRPTVLTVSAGYVF